MTTEPSPFNTFTMDLSEEEVHVIRVRRGKLRTGYDHHTDSRGRHYFWCMGQQPEGAVLNEIAAASVEAAADKFLDVYLARSETDKAWTTPQRRLVPEPPKRHTAPYRRFAYQNRHMSHPLIEFVWHRNDARAMELRDDFVCWLDADWTTTEIPKKDPS